MAHEFEQGLFVGEPAWHGLGTLLSDAPSIDEALRISGLDREVSLAPLYLSSGREVVGHRAVLREDGAQLGVVGSDFTVLQDRAAFEPFRPWVESGEVTIEAAGSLRGGRRTWILGRVRDAIQDVVPGDPIKGYVLFAHGHDGSLAVSFGHTAVRVVCQNTLSMALGSGADMARIKHTSGVHVRYVQATDAFQQQRFQLAEQAKIFRELAGRKLGSKNLRRYVRETLREGAGNDETIALRGVDDIVRLADPDVGRGVTRPGTLWAGYNAITEYATHERGRTADTRVNNMWFGDGARLVRRALDVAVAYAGKLPLAA